MLFRSRQPRKGLRDDPGAIVVAVAGQVLAHQHLQGVPAANFTAPITVPQALPSLLARGLTPQDMLRVNAARPTFLTLEPGESLYYQGDDCHNIYLLLDGWAFRHQILEDGRRQILDFALPGVVFGLPGSGVMTHSLETLTNCTFSVFTRERLFDLMRDVATKIDGRSAELRGLLSGFIGRMSTVPTSVWGGVAATRMEMAAGASDATAR